MTPQLPHVRELGDYLREQRELAQLSVRQLSADAGISNPYLSQIERGLRKPSAEILQALASGLRISAESLYIRAGLLEPREGPTPTPQPEPVSQVPDAIRADPRLTDQQRQLMLDLYESYVAGEPARKRTTRTARATRTPSTEPSSTKARAPRASRATAQSPRA